MDKIVVVGDAEMVLGFKLAGITRSYPVQPADAEAIANSLFSESDVGIIIMQDSHFDALSHKAKRLIDTASKPVVVTVGTRSASKSDDLQKLIKRAIGITLDK